MGTPNVSTIRKFLTVAAALHQPPK
jgi:hypothetical protein